MTEEFLICEYPGKNWEGVELLDTLDKVAEYIQKKAIDVEEQTLFYVVRIKDHESKDNPVAVYVNGVMYVPMNVDASTDDWTLTAKQALFMLQHHNVFEDGTTEDVRELAASVEYLNVFGEMSIDEALDRRDCMLNPDDSMGKVSEAIERLQSVARTLNAKDLEALGNELQALADQWAGQNDHE